MRNLLSAAGFAGLALVFAACGNDDPPPPIHEGKGGKGGSGFAPAAGKPGAGAGEGGAAGGDAVDGLAPIVEITSPEAVEDPNQEGVLFGTEVEVVCTAKQSSEPDAEPVDRTSVKLELLDADDMVIEQKPGSPTGNADEYSNTFIVTEYPAGALGIRCTAKDRAGNMGEEKISTLLDQGPLITFLSPEIDSFHPLQENLGIRFTVEAVPLADGDDGADVATVALSVAGEDIELDGQEVSPGEYQVAVDLTKPPFDTAPNGPLALTVRAANKRKPTPVIETLTQVVSIDGAHPTIEITAPRSGAVVGGVVALEFTVSDDVSGVDPDSIVVSLNQKVNAYNQGGGVWTELGGGQFRFEFDSREITDNTQVIVNVNATDRVGNESQANTLVVSLDNVPPWVDLDPLNVRTIVRKNPPPHECSVSFDPVGSEALDDEFRLTIPGTMIRLLVYEDTNFVEGLNQYYSKVKPGTVRFFVKKATDGALLIDEDENGSGPCIDVPVADLNGSNTVLLGPITAVEAPQYGPGNEYPVPGVDVACQPRATETNPPPLLCGGDSDMWHVIEHEARDSGGAHEPVIYGIAVEPSPALRCTGDRFQMSTLVGEDGWVCLVGRAMDWAGNVGISPPLRVCVDDPNRPGSPSCATNLAEAAPSCTNGCTPPPHWDPGGIVIE